jgi:hypothetical protein
MVLPFKKSRNTSKISPSDVDAVVQKLKSLYGKYAEVYGEKLFNLHEFERRYRDALIAKIDLTNFCHAEITVFEELKKRVQRKDPPEKKHVYADVADRIIKENLQKIRKYRKVDFHPDADEETRYLLGAVMDFYYESWGRVMGLIKKLGDRSLIDFMEKLENDFSYYAVPIRGLYSRAADDYMLVLSRKDPRESERASYNFIKYGAILLNNCLKLTVDALNYADSGNEGNSVQELRGIQGTLRSIIEDFRLADIREY